MRSRRSPWRYGLLAAGFALSIAAVGCGDDDTTTDNGGSGGSSGKGGTGGSSGKGGTGGSSGSSGKGGTGGTGGGASPTACISDTTAVFKGQANALSAECISCACNDNAKALEACNAVATDCWGLINCYDAHHCTDTQCAIDNCSTFVAKGGTPAMPVGDILQGTCSEKCVGESDAGAPDAG
jgi:hypothetical protein